MSFPSGFFRTGRDHSFLRTYDHGGSGGGSSDVICIEAEDMHLRYYGVERNYKASGDKLIKLSGSKGYASTDFPGDDGVYDFTIDFIDENDGKGQIDIFINGVFITCISLNQQTGDHTNGFRSVTLPGITLAEGDEIKLKGTRDGGEYARIDKISFTPVDTNEAPVAVDDSAGTDEDTSVTVSVLQNDSDPENDTLTIIDVADGANGSAAINDDGTITYTPNADFFGSDIVNYTISDGNGGTATASVEITVAPVNDAPIAKDDNAETTEETAVTISVLNNDSDADGDVLSLLAVADPANGSVVINADGTITYTPNKDFDGVDSFVYTVSDGNGGTDEATVAVTVAGANDADDDCVETTESLAVDGNVLTNDNLPGDMSVVAIEGGDVGSELSVVSDGGRTGTLVVEADGSFRFDPDGGFEDLGVGESDSVSLTYTVAGSVAGGSTQEKVIDFEGLHAGTVVDNQFDGVRISAQRKWDFWGHKNDAMVFDSTHPTGGDDDLGHAPEQGNLLIISEDNKSYDPDDNARGGKIWFEFDEPRTVSSLTFIDIEEGAKIYLYDSRGYKIDYIWVHSTKNGGVRVQDIGVDNVAKMKVVLNGSGAVDDLVYLDEVDTVVQETATLKVVINGENDGPIAADDTLGTDEDTAVTGNVLTNDEDLDGDTLTVSAVSGGAVGTAFSVTTAAGNTGFVTIDANGDVLFDPIGGFEPLNDGDTDLVTVTYTVSDGAGGTDQGDLTITIDGLTDNRPPSIAEPVVLFAPENQTSAGALNGADPDPGDVLTWSISGGVDQDFFEIDVDTGEVSFLVAPDFETPLDDDQDNRYFIEITLSDGLASVSEGVLVNVLDVDENTAPIGVDDLIIGTEDAAFAGNLLDNDVDAEGGDLRVVEVSGGVVGIPFEVSTDGARVVTVSVNQDGEIEVNPDGRFDDLPDGISDTLTLSYQLADEGGLVSEASVTIEINGLNDAPDFLPPTEFSVLEDQTTAGTVVAEDADGDPVTYSIEGGADADLLVIDPVTGELSFVVAPDFEQPQDAGGNNVYDVIVGATDGRVLTTSDVSVEVINVNDPPEFTAFVDETIGGPVDINIGSGAGVAGIRLQEFGVIGQLFATDLNGDTFEFVKSGGEDAQFFEIDALTGKISAPFGLPFLGSADDDNVFEVIFSVIDENGASDEVTLGYSLITAG